MFCEKLAKSLVQLIVVASVPVLGLTACAVEPASEGEPSNGVGAEVEHVGSTAEALTTPPSGVGITQVGGSTYHMKNGTGLCAYWEGAGGAMKTASCSATDSKQRFVAYQLQDGKYQICIPETLTYNPDGLLWDYPSRTTGASYTATCLYPSKIVNGVPQEYRFGNVMLSFSIYDYFYGSSPYKSYGYFSWSDPYIEAQSRRVTRDTNGMIVPGRASGNADQQWSFY